MDIEKFKQDLARCLEALKDDLSQIRTGRATPEVVEDVLVDAYEVQAPIKNYANITVMDAKTIAIQPWDKSIVDNVSKAISNANLGLSSITEGDRVLVKLPDLTEERRKDYVKIMGERVEDSRVAVRNVRQKYMKEVDEAQSSGLSEDDADRKREEAEKLVKDMNQQIEDLRSKKEEDLMTI